MAHIVNPVNAPPGSSLSLAQMVSFETMRRARAEAAGAVDVQLYATAFPEDRVAVPPEFFAAPDLDRSVLDVGAFRSERKLPLMRDVLYRLYATTDAEYLIYTNADIGVQPHFYISVSRLIDAGYDALVINRRTIPENLYALDDIPLMYAAAGRPHRGWDCFIFRRELFSDFDLGAVCVGAPRVGLALLANLMVQADSFRELQDARLTFHRGDDREWNTRSQREYAAHNTREVIAALHRLEQRHGPFSRRTPPGRFLFRKRYFGPLYEAAIRGTAFLESRSGM